MMMTLLAWAMAFCINPQNPSTMLTATQPGSYYQQVKTEYDSTNNKTYGLFIRYDIRGEGHDLYVLHSQVRILPGSHTAADLAADALPADNGILFIK